MAELESWTLRGPRPSALLRLHRNSFIHVLVLGGTAPRRAAMAHAFHNESPVQAGPFVELDCGAEHATLRLALQCWLSAGDASNDNPLRACERGTLFLDSLETLSEDLQRQLLAFLRRRARRDCDAWAGRITAGATLKLPELAASGAFLPELFDALDKVRIELGSPAERRSA